MTQSRISFNVIRVPNRGAFFDLLYKLNPVAINILNDAGLCVDVKAKLPDCDVIFRLKGGSWKDDDGEGILSVSAVDYLREMISKLNGDKRIRISCGNEMPLNNRVIEYLCELVRLANEQGLSLCVLNLAVGNPEPAQWAIAKPLLELLAVHRQHVLGLHEYFGAVPTSGLYGGYPDNANVQPGKPGGINLIPRNTWPEDVGAITRYHLGRFNFLIQYCKAEKITPPRIILTEWGADETGDIKPWLETLKKTAPYPSIRGWRTLVDQWRAWFPRWDAEAAYAEMLTWADKTIYQNSAVECQCIFQLGNDTDWASFDVWNATTLLNKLVAHSQEAEVVPMLKPQNASDRVLVVLNDAPEGEINVRNGAGELYRIVGKIRNGEKFHVYWTPPVSDIRGRKWFWADTADGAGWVCQVRDNVFMPVNIPTPPVVVPPPPESTPMEPSEDEIALQREIDARTKIAEACNAISIDLKRLAIAEADLIEVLRARKEQIRQKRIAQGDTMNKFRLTLTALVLSVFLVAPALAQELVTNTPDVTPTAEELPTVEPAPAEEPPIVVVTPLFSTTEIVLIVALTFAGVLLSLNYRNNAAIAKTLLDAAPQWLVDLIIDTSGRGFDELARRAKETPTTVDDELVKQLRDEIMKLLKPEIEQAMRTAQNQSMIYPPA